MFRGYSQRPSGSTAVLPLLAHVPVATAILSILLVPSRAGIVHAAPQHPNLSVNATELVRLRARLETEPRRARLLEQVKEDADAGRIRPEHENLLYS